VVLATAFHEIGHATACRYGGARPGVMGVGIYIVWPAFYTDITDAYRLGKVGRLRTDLGGMYFNAIFALAAGAVYFATGFEPLLLLVVLQTFAVIQQSMPFLRLDGYYILSDLTGVPDMLSRIKPVLASLVPGRPADDRVTELKPWVRAVVTAYLMTLVPVLGFVFLMMLIHAPRVFATGYDSFAVHWDRVGPDLSAGQGALGAVDVLQMVALALPALGMVYTVSRVGHRFGAASWRWSAGNPLRRGGVVTATAALAGFAAFMWWPHGEYRPIQPGERGTIQDGIRSVAKIPTGRPSLTAARQIELGGAPAQRTLQRERRRMEQSPAPDRRPPSTTHRRTVETWQQLEWPSNGAQGDNAISGGSYPPAFAPPPAGAAPPAQQPPPGSTDTTPTQSTSTTPTDTTPTNTETTPTTTETTPTSTDTTSTTPTDTTPTNTDTTQTTTTP
jgi:putative peptide zinc metalloprotease protein